MNETKVKVLFFGAVAEIVNANEIDFAFETGETAKITFEKIVAKFPEISNRFENSLLFSINQTYSNGSEIIKLGDELAIFPPVSGG